MLGITLGVAALIVVISIMNGLESELKDRMLSSVSHGVITTENDKISKDYKVQELVLSSDVIGVSPQIIDDVMIHGEKSLTATRLYGIDPETYPKSDLIRSSTGTSAFANLLPGSYEIILGSALAEDLDVRPGDKVRVISVSNVKYTLMGRVPSQRLFTVSSIFNVGVSDSERSTVLANIEDVRKLVRMDKSQISGFRVWLEDPFNIDRFIKDVASKDLGVVVKDWRQEKGEFFQSVAMEKIMMSLMLALIILVAVFNMLSALVMVVTSKVPEIAILRTMGISRRGIVGIFMVEGALSGVVGSIFGVVLGLILTNNIDRVLSSIGLNFMISAGGAGIPVVVDVVQISLIVLITIVFSFGITIYPSLRAAYISPAQSLRYE